MSDEKYNLLYGNQHSRKNSLESVSEILKKAITLANTEKETYTIGFGKNARQEEGWKYDFIGAVLIDIGLYRSFMERYIIEFPEVIPLYNDLKSVCERNCVDNSRTQKVREATSIVNLKAMHGWKDRTDITTNDKPITKASQLSDAELDEKIKKLTSGKDNDSGL